MLIILSIQRDVRPTFFFPPGGTGRFTLDRTGLLGVSHLGKSEVTPKIAWFICGHVLTEGNIPCLKELFIKWRTVLRSKGEGTWISTCCIQEAIAGDFCVTCWLCVYTWDLLMNHVWWRNMASHFSYDSGEEDWDIRSLQFVNSQLEKYLNMVRILSL